MNHPKNADVDAFYCSVFELENPALKQLPFCVQQKQIIVTCNYEARRRGLHKLQLIRDAKAKCPDAVIVLGEDLTKFRDASKAIYRFLRSFSWNDRVETLGFDEVFLDVTDIIEYNLHALLKQASFEHAFFNLQRNDPTKGFAYDASSIAGHAYSPNPPVSTSEDRPSDSLLLRLTLGSHLAHHIRMQLEHHMGYTSSVGISTSKLLSKMAGNLNKPSDQTTLLPPYASDNQHSSNNVASFMDAHDIGRVPYIGFKMAYKLQQYALKRRGGPDSDDARSENQLRVTVGDLRSLPGVDAQVLEEVLAGPGMQRGIGFKTWCLLHGVDDTEVAQAKDTPKQISIEDSYLRMDTMEGVLRELLTLSTSLLRRMRVDLTGEEVQGLGEDSDETSTRKWLVHPKTLRLSTRPRPPPGPDGRRGRAAARISRSTYLPTFVFSLVEPVEFLAERLVHESLLALFRQLHPEKTGWDLSLINVAVTNMAETAGTSKSAAGRDIGKMFKTQEKTVEPWRFVDVGDPSHMEIGNVSWDEATTMGDTAAWDAITKGSEDNLPLSQATQSFDISNGWDEPDGDEHGLGSVCPLCDAAVPDFAIAAHLRFHEIND